MQQSVASALFPIADVIVPSKITNEALLVERRRMLVAAATDLFVRNGFHRTSIREVAAAAGWNMGTLYLYISSKDDVLYLITRAVLDRLREGLGVVERQPTAWATLRAFATQFFTLIDRMQDEIRLLYRETETLQANPRYTDGIRQQELDVRGFFIQVLEEGIAAGEFRPTHTQLFAHDLIMLAHMWALKNWRLRHEFSFEEYVERQLDLLFSQLQVTPATASAPRVAADPPRQSAI
jgi:AcrR family transcriptional regulator